MKCCISSGILFELHASPVPSARVDPRSRQTRPPAFNFRFFGLMPCSLGCTQNLNTSIHLQPCTNLHLVEVVVYSITRTNERSSVGAQAIMDGCTLHLGGESSLQSALLPLQLHWLTEWVSEVENSPFLAVCMNVSQEQDACRPMGLSEMGNV